MALETSEIDRYDEMPLLDNRSSTQIQVVAPGRLSKLAKARRELIRRGKSIFLLPLPP